MALVNLYLLLKNKLEQSLSLLLHGKTLMKILFLLDALVLLDSSLSMTLRLTP